MIRNDMGKNRLLREKGKILNKYQFKIGLVAFFSVFIGLFLTVIVSYHGVQMLFQDATDEMNKGLNAVTNEYLDNYIHITGKLVESQIQNYFEEQAMLADIFQKTIDHEEEFSPVIKKMCQQPFFKDHLKFQGRWYQNSSSEPAVVLVQRYLLDDKNHIKPHIKEQIDQSVLLDLLMPSVYKYGADKQWVYFSGGLNASFMRIVPWNDAGTALDKIYPRHTNNPNWEAFNPGLVGGWEKEIKEGLKSIKDLSSLAIIKAPIQDGGTGKIIMTMNHPIWNKERNKFRGSISIDVALEDIINYIKKIKLANTGFAYIIQSNRNVIAINDEGAKILGLKVTEDAIKKGDTGIGFNPMERFLNESIYEDIQNICLPKGTEITKEQIRIDKKEYMVVQKNLKPLNTWNKDKGFYEEIWTLGFVMPKEEFFSSMISARNKINHSRNLIVGKQIFIALLTIIGLSGFIYIMTERMTEGLKKLELATIEIMNKNYDVKVDVESDDEIGNLACAIRNMIGEIKSTFQQLHRQNKILKNEIAEREKKERQIQYLKDYDPLTNLPKEKLFLNVLKEFIQDREEEDISGIVMIMGLDNFRNINEVLGHEGGNEVLKMVSNRLKSIAKGNGIVARMNGDEFAILYNHIGAVEEIAIRAEEIMNTIEAGYKVYGEEIFITASIGISLYPVDSIEPSEIVRFASSALVHAKEKGKGNYQFYDVKMNKRAEERNKMITAFRHGIENNELLLYYQPQINLHTKKWIGMEALIRWDSPIFGKVMPNTFIPLVEETGLIVDMGEWVLKRACEQNKKWHDMGYKDLIVAVNLSPRQFYEKDFVKKVQLILNETKLPPKFLELEVTERLFIDNKEQVIGFLYELQKMGVKIAIDDFGTGYSSLSYLKDLPVDKLKIDRSFIKDIPDKDDGSIANIIIELGKNLNLKINAEGIETIDQENFLINKKCNEAQGYYYSPPLDVKTFTFMLRKNGRTI
ncbi:EAL domain-containing protein [Crassaminicella profunda]|uniref:EAL domain-containing protein n=1 Tax=Crassaminicella profunda TaxID=1286698 RepID=UPI001CA7A4FA|nr:EAL domain-containing protein [Crassaminicella profunda]QZY53664.1 EAL domain-containing protein [Crassaminicella profunda]